MNIFFCSSQTSNNKIGETADEEIKKSERFNEMCFVLRADKTNTPSYKRILKKAFFVVETSI